MGALDDDFGDIYEDTRFKALHSAIYSPVICHPYHQQGDEDNGAQSTCGSDSPYVRKNANEKANEPPSSVGPEGVSFMEAGETDSEDDFNIVLNDDRCCSHDATGAATAMLGAVEDVDIDNGNAYMFTRPRMEIASDLGVRGNNQVGGYRMNYGHYKYVRPCAIGQPGTIKVNGASDYASFSLQPVKGECGDNRFCQNQISSAMEACNPCDTANSHGFSFPLHRTIMDIDSFEQKPWRYLGADITNFFNFGFDEESWKLYCRSLPIGRAIQVESCTHERVPSVDIWRPQSRDSDAIHILLHENSELSYQSNLPEAVQKDLIVIKASVCGDIERDEKLDFLCSEQVAENGQSECSRVDGFKKPFELVNTSDIVAPVINKGNNHAPDVAHGYQEKNVCQSDVRNSNYEDAGKNTAESDAYSLGSEPSLLSDRESGEITSSSQIGSHSTACEHIHDIYTDAENAYSNLQDSFSSGSYRDDELMDGSGWGYPCSKQYEGCEDDICQNLKHSAGRNCSIRCSSAGSDDRDTSYLYSSWCSYGRNHLFFSNGSRKKRQHNRVMHAKRSKTGCRRIEGPFGRSKEIFFDKHVEHDEAKEYYQSRVLNFTDNADLCRRKKYLQGEYSIKRRHPKNHMEEENDYVRGKLEVQRTIRSDFWTSRHLAEMKMCYKRKRIEGWRTKQKDGKHFRRFIDGGACLHDSASLETDTHEACGRPIPLTNVRDRWNCRQHGLPHVRSLNFTRELSPLPLDRPMWFKNRAACGMLLDQRSRSPNICRRLSGYDMTEPHDRRSKNNLYRSTERYQRQRRQIRADELKCSYCSDGHVSDSDDPDGTIYSENNVNFLKGHFPVRSNGVCYDVDSDSHRLINYGLLCGRMPFSIKPSSRHEWISDNNVSGDDGICPNFDRLCYHGNEPGTVAKTIVNKSYDNIGGSKVRRVDIRSTNLSNVNVGKGKLLKRCRPDRRTTRIKKLNCSIGRGNMTSEERKDKCLDMFEGVPEACGVKVKEPTFNVTTAERMRGSEDVTGKSDGITDKARIRAALAKMEKRRERFKNPVLVHVNMEMKKIEPPVVEPQLQRPARKRRWASKSSN